MVFWDHSSHEVSSRNEVLEHKQVWEKDVHKLERGWNGIWESVCMHKELESLPLHGGESHDVL